MLFLSDSLAGPPEWTENQATRKVIADLLARLYVLGYSRGINLGVDPRRILVFTYLKFSSTALSINKWPGHNNAILPMAHQGMAYTNTRNGFDHTVLISPSALGYNLVPVFQTFPDRFSMLVADKNPKYTIPEKAKFNILYQLQGMHQFHPLYHCM